MKEVLPRVGWKFKTNLSSRRGSPSKFLIIYSRLITIGCLNLDPKGKGVVIHHVRNLLVENVVRNMWVNV